MLHERLCVRGNSYVHDHGDVCVARKSWDNFFFLFFFSLQLSSTYFQFQFHIWFVGTEGFSLKEGRKRGILRFVSPSRLYRCIFFFFLVGYISFYEQRELNWSNVVTLVDWNDARTSFSDVSLISRATRPTRDVFHSASSCFRKKGTDLRDLGSLRILFTILHICRLKIYGMRITCEMSKLLQTTVWNISINII